MMVYGIQPKMMAHSPKSHYAAECRELEHCRPPTPNKKRRQTSRTHPKSMFQLFGVYCRYRIWDLMPPQLGTVDSKKLEYGPGKNYASRLWDRRTIIFQLCGFYCNRTSSEHESPSNEPCDPKMTRVQGSLCRGPWNP